ncbi:MAG TPA: Arc family DNA-binding protein [Alphaproteobacteria bacterium]|nr:Arc family DNA-binding protein [Alphaproteobacteria bacterium]
MVTRDPSAPVQLKLRMRERLRAQIDQAAKAKGVSLNAEIVDRLQSSTLTEVLSEGWFGLADLQRFQHYVQVIKLALAAVREPEDLWLGYAQYVPFPIDANDHAAVKAANEAIRREVDRERRASREFMATHGEATPADMVRKIPPEGRAPGEIHPDAIHRDHARRVERASTTTRKRRKPT